MKMIARLLTFCAFVLALADPNDPTQIENYDEKVKTYKLGVPGRQPITVIEKDDNNWRDISLDIKEDKDDEVIKHLMTHIVHDLDGNEPRCYGPSCQDSYYKNNAQEDFDDYMLAAEKLKDFRDFPAKDRLQAITALAAKLKKDKYKHDRFSQIDSDTNEDDDGGKVIGSWNILKVKQHKHPFDDKDGWVTLEPVPWSSSKISKWKPNIKKHKPNPWSEDDNRFPDEDRFSSNQQFVNNYNYPVKKPVLSRPGFINNKLHVPADYESESPSKPAWSKPQQASYPSMWSPDESRRPSKPNCDTDEQYANDDSVYYGMSDSVVTDTRPSNFPFEYEALHQASSSLKRPLRRPTQVVYSGPPDYDGDRSSRPPYGDGQWVLLSTTKGYRNKKRQRSLNLPPDEVATVTSHQAVSLTVLPVDNLRTNMTTSHGGMLEVEKSFQTVEESKQDMDKQQDLDVAASENKPVKNRVMRKKLVSNVSPDSSTLLAAVGAGMVPATMAMVVPMMLGRRRRRRDLRQPLNLDAMLRRYQ
ncbi:hypothetical protein K1T71_008378 [Dendrolimus kikuchii]|uniref:Uncharacterized protein n=1 Tax=Dendrolimus kikuchii TaxID=765133 RepID=A0ACC1CWU7_9NEOP|nr:hypothetical protein K1T71_008378 [Dendrolimus kikuchii]